MFSKDFMIKFNFVTNILLISLLVAGGSLWAETNGVWHHAEDVTGGIFALDQQHQTKNFTFINNVSVNATLYVHKLCNLNGSKCQAITNNESQTQIYGECAAGSFMYGVDVFGNVKCRNDQVSPGGSPGGSCHPQTGESCCTGIDGCIRRGTITCSGECSGEIEDNNGPD